MNNFLTFATYTFLEILFPSECLCCGNPLFTLAERQKPICRHCDSGLKRLKARVCSHCGYPLISEKDICMRCRTKKDFFVLNRSLYIYDESAKELLIQYKIFQRKEAAPFLASELYLLMKENSLDFPVIPVPCSPKKKKKRSWDQVELVCNYLHKNHKMEIVKALKRVDSESQKHLNKEMRSKNLKDKIQVTKVKIPENCILLDDVITTGATLNECARVLLEHGAKKVFAITIAYDA